MTNISATGLNEMPSNNLKKVKITECEEGDEGDFIKKIEELNKMQLKERLIEEVQKKGHPLSQVEFIKVLKDLGIEGYQYEAREAIMKAINKYFENR